MMSDNNETYHFIVDIDGNLINNDEFSEREHIVYEENREYALHLLAEYQAWPEAAEKNDQTFFDVGAR